MTEDYSWQHGDVDEWTENYIDEEDDYIDEEDELENIENSKPSIEECSERDCSECSEKECSEKEFKEDLARNLYQLKYLKKYANKFLEQLTSYVKKEEKLSEEAEKDFGSNLLAIMIHLSDLDVLDEDLVKYLQALIPLLEKAIDKAREYDYSPHVGVLKQIIKNIHSYLDLMERSHYYKKEGEYSPKKYRKYYPYPEEYDIPEYLSKEELSMNLEDKSPFEKYLILKESLKKKIENDVKTRDLDTELLELGRLAKENILEYLARRDAVNEQIYSISLPAEDRIKLVEMNNQVAKEQLEPDTIPKDIQEAQKWMDEKKEEQELEEKNKPIVELTDEEERMTIEEYKKHLDTKYLLEKAIDEILKNKREG